LTEQFDNAPAVHLTVNGLVSARLEQRLGCIGVVRTHRRKRIFIPLLIKSHNQNILPIHHAQLAGHLDTVLGKEVARRRDALLNAEPIPPAIANPISAFCLDYIQGAVTRLNEATIIQVNDDAGPVLDIPKNFILDSIALYQERMTRAEPASLVNGVISSTVLVGYPEPAEINLTELIHMVRSMPTKPFYFGANRIRCHRRP